MTVSELIQYLKDAHDEYGNFPVVIESDEFAGMYNFARRVKIIGNKPIGTPAGHFSEPKTVVAITL